MHARVLVLCTLTATGRSDEGPWAAAGAAGDLWEGSGRLYGEQTTHLPSLLLCVHRRSAGHFVEWQQPRARDAAYVKVLPGACAFFVRVFTGIRHAVFVRAFLLESSMLFFVRAFLLVFGMLFFVRAFLLEFGMRFLYVFFLLVFGIRFFVHVLLFTIGLLTTLTGLLLWMS